MSFRGYSVSAITRRALRAENTEAGTVVLSSRYPSGPRSTWVRTNRSLHSLWELGDSNPRLVLPRGGDGGTRTRGLYIANVALSQLSYTPSYTTGADWLVWQGSNLRHPD